MTTTIDAQPVVPLASWIQERVSAVYNATSQAAFDMAFEAFLHKDVQIVVNGTRLTREDYKRQLHKQNLTLTERPVTVTFANAVEVPVKTVDCSQTGSVGIFYKATVAEYSNIRDPRSLNSITSSLNAIVTHEPEAGTKVSILSEVWTNRLEL